MGQVSKSNSISNNTVLGLLGSYGQKSFSKIQIQACKLAYSPALVILYFLPSNYI